MTVIVVMKLSVFTEPEHIKLRFCTRDLLENLKKMNIRLKIVN